MLQFIQYLRGYVCIRVWGYSPERFMNLCSNHDIFLWNIENCGEYYTMCITVSGFRRLKSIVKKTGTKVAIQKRYGLPFFVPKIKRRKIFMLGFLGSLLFWVWMSAFIWAVDVEGNYFITEDIFMDFLEENEIHVGMKRADVDIEALEKNIRQKFNIVTWTSARIDGTRLVIQIKENEAGNWDKSIGKPGNVGVPKNGGMAGAGETSESTEQHGNEGQPGSGEQSENGGVPGSSGQPENEFGSDLLAEADGVIVSMVTRKGVPVVGIGSEVKKGDVLVEGSVPVYNEDATVRKYQYYDADADVFIERSFHKTETLPLNYKKKEYTGAEKKELLLAVMDKDLILRAGRVKYENYDKVTDKKQVKLLDNFYLPLYYGSSVNREYVITDNKYTKEEVKNIFSEKLINFVASLEEKGVQIIKKNVTINKKNKTWQMNMDFQIVEKTGSNVPIVPDLSVEAEEQSEEETAD